MDPSGHDGLFGTLASAVSSVVSTAASVAQAVAPVASAALDATTGIPSMIADVQTIFSGNASTLDKVLAGGDFLLNGVMDVTLVVGVGEGLKAAYVGLKAATHVGEEVGAHAVEHAGEDAVEHVAAHEAEDAAEHAAEDGAEQSAADAAGEGDCGNEVLSFSADTVVATPSGEVPIAALTAGNKVEAYDSISGKSSTQVIAATSVHRDDNLVDLTLRVVKPHKPGAVPHTSTVTKGTRNADVAHTAAASTAPATFTTRDETIHTTTNHPWLTADHGWLPAGFLRVDEPVQELDGAVAIVVSVRAVAGTAVMWDLTVNNLHTFAVGFGQYVVHNCPRRVDWQQGDQSGSGQSRDRMRGRDAKRVDRNVGKAATHLGMTEEERWGYGDYIEQLKDDVDAPHDRNSTWQQLLKHGRDYLRIVRGGEE